MVWNNTLIRVAGADIYGSQNLGATGKSMSVVIHHIPMADRVRMEMRMLKPSSRNYRMLSNTRKLVLKASKLFCRSSGNESPSMVVRCNLFAF